MHRFRKPDLATFIVLGLLALIVGSAVALGAGETTGTNTACDTAPDQTIGVNGTPVYTATGPSHCNTVTYTIPTVTVTVTDTGTTSTTPTTTTSTTSTTSTTPTTSTTSTTTTTPPPGQYALPAGRTYDWNPGLNAVGGIPSANWTVVRTVSPSGGDDTAAIQTALNSCPANGVVQLAAGVFHITGTGLAFENSSCVLRGAGPGPGNLAAGLPPVNGTTGGTYLVDTVNTTTPVMLVGPRYGFNNDVGTPTSLTADAARGSSSVTVASTAGLSAGSLVIVNETTDPSISRWEGGNNQQNSGWFEQPNRPLGETMKVASISGNTVTFTTDLPIGYQVARSAHLYPLTNVVRNAGIEDLYLYGGTNDGVEMVNCDHCWVKHVEGTWDYGAAVNVMQSFGTEIRDSYFHDSAAGLHAGGSSYGISLGWYASDSLVENNAIVKFNKVDVMRSAGGGNVFGYNYMDDGADLAGAWVEDELEGSHMTTPHYELFEGNQAANADSDDVWGNAVDITYFRNDLLGQLRDFPSSSPFRAAGLTQYSWWYSFVGNVLGTPADVGNFTAGYETINRTWANSAWTLCYQHVDSTPDGGKCLATVLRDGNYDYLTKQVHWHGIGGTGSGNGLTPPANSTLPASMYLAGKPGFFGSAAWPWVDGSSAASPLPGALPARARYDAGTPNAG